jgi:hypothetical protein
MVVLYRYIKSEGEGTGRNGSRVRERAQSVDAIQIWYFTSILVGLLGKLSVFFHLLCVFSSRRCRRSAKAFPGR